MSIEARLHAIAEGITGPCSCDPAYKNRGLIAPDCVWHECAEEIVDALKAERALSMAGGERWMDKPQDIVERLQSESFTNGDTDIRWEAADEITRLRSELQYWCTDAVEKLERLRSERPAMDGWREGREAAAKVAHERWLAFQNDVDRDDPVSRAAAIEAKCIARDIRALPCPPGAP